jgi:hypothetical protein
VGSDYMLFLGATVPAASNGPFELWRTVASGLSRHCSELENLARGPDRGPQVREAARAALGFLDEAIQVHLANEECALLPALRAAMPANERQALEVASCTLRALGRVLNEQWADLRPQLAALARGACDALDPGLVRSHEALWAAYADLWRREVYPLVERHLPLDAWEEIGFDMVARRILLLTESEGFRDRREQAARDRPPS